jgi:branched-chain amino acid transport system substrate-binding protein
MLGAAPLLCQSVGSSGSQASHPLGKWLYDKAGYRRLIIIAPNYAMGYEQTALATVITRGIFCATT